MRTIITGLNGATYHDFPNPAYGGWNQMFYGPPLNYYLIGNNQYNFNPPSQTSQVSFPYIGPNVPFRFFYPFY
ncbi:hypothetical protein [Niallia sp. NCCP-28]|uniref:hypothetical protein n=1 Tax=Niallia sp. NCCP-28 TaxID=2934712 RepID=UPI00208B426C|nr:hypothetical protein [Niallia sp. NCCP-28]GKU82724.1 hypothetical protein NCCP28_21200 [Niallia sp. NCCP-28]